MSEPVYYEGLTIEFDSADRRLTIEGRRVPVDYRSDRMFTAPELPDVPESPLPELAKAIIDRSPQLPKRQAARLEQLDALGRGVESWNAWRLMNPTIRPILYGAGLSRQEVPAGLRQANFANAVLIGADLSGQDLTEANFHEANLGDANLSGATLAQANFCRADLYRTDLSGAILHDANLQGSQLARTKFLRKAELVECALYGLSAWDVELDDTTIQRDLTIFYTPKTVKDPQGRDTQLSFTAHDIRVAQFIYLLLDNARIHDVFDTTQGKVVLILGRFDPDFKETLDDIWHALHSRGYAPVLFDFKHPNLMETITTLAGISRFVVADITSALMVREELPAILKLFPSKPVRPIIIKGQSPYQSFGELQSPSLLDLYHYDDRKQLIDNLSEAVIDPAETWIRTKGPSARQRLEQENEELKRQNAELRKRIDAREVAK